MAARKLFTVLLLVAAAVPVSLAQLQCPQCPGSWAPVCGRDGAATSAFSSYCAMTRFNCINRTNYRFTSALECPALRRSYNAIP